MSYFIGIDVGGTNIVCGLVDSAGKLIRKVRLPTDAKLGFDHVLTTIVQMVKGLLFDVQIPLNQVVALGLGVPGLVDPLMGNSLFAANLGWHNKDVAGGLREQLGIPIFVDNDVRMYVFGEATVGAGRGYDCVLGITIGTGLAAAIVEQDRIYYGGGFMAGELGHIRIEGENRLCACGMRGCLETVVSATGMAKQAREALAKGRNSILRQWFPERDFDRVTAEDVSRAYDLGDGLAIDVMSHTGKLLGRGLSYAVTLFSPDVVIIGGGGALAGERLFEPMRSELQRSLHSRYWDRIAIRTAEFLEDAGVLGSAIAAKRRVAS